MKRARKIFVVALLVGLAWSAVTMAANPIALNTYIDFDAALPDVIVLRWNPVDGAANYKAFWGPEKRPGTWYSAPVSGTFIKIYVTPGEGMRVRVIAYDDFGHEIARSVVDVVKLPKGKQIGSGKLQTLGIFTQSLPTGSDRQNSRGDIWFQIYENPSLGGGKFEIYGLGKSEFREVAKFKGGSFRAKGRAPVFVTGVLRYPADQAEDELDACLMDLKITEAYKGRVIEVNGSINGIPLPNGNFDNSPVMRAKGLPAIKGPAYLLPDKAGWNTYSVKVTEIGINPGTGCGTK